MQNATDTTPARAEPSKATSDDRDKGAKDATLSQIRDLIYGDSKRETEEQLAHAVDRQREFEELARREMRKMADDLRIMERRNEEARRAIFKDLSETVESMAKSIAKLAE